MRNKMGGAECGGEEYGYKILSTKSQGNRLLTKTQGNINNGSSRNWTKSVEWIQKDQHKVQWWAFVNRMLDLMFSQWF